MIENYNQVSIAQFWIEKLSTKNHASILNTGF